MGKFVSLEGFYNGATFTKNSTGINFDVLNYTTEEQMIASTPNKVTIGVVAAEMSDWTISAAAPSNPIENMVWIYSSKTSIGEFNALQEHGIQIYPSSAYQYKNSAWVTIPMRVFIAEEWLQMELVWYKDGQWNKEIFGNVSFGTAQSDGSLLCYRYAEITSSIAVDATPFSYFQYDITRGNYGRVMVTIKDENNATLVYSDQIQDVGTHQVCDLSTIDCPIKIHIYVYGNANSDSTYLNNLKLVP